MSIRPRLFGLRVGLSVGLRLTSTLSVGAAGAFGATLLASQAHAEANPVDTAITEFKAGRYDAAAVQFYNILQFAEDYEESDIVEAQFGLAASFKSMDLPLAALKYYEDIVKVGSDHPYFKNAIEGLLDIADQLNEELKVPQVLDSIYDANADALRKMDPRLLQRIHYVLGKYAFNRSNISDAKSFLKTVKPDNPKYASAQYVQGLIRLGFGRSGKSKVDFDAAFEHFENARKAIPATSKDEEELALRDLTTLALGRTYYERAYAMDDGPKRADGLQKAVSEYRKIPRFSVAWSDALFERAWAHAVSGEYGRALGAIYSLNAPYFQDYFYPEARILQSIVYYYNCQWDRVNDVLEDTKNVYEPMVQDLESILSVERSDDEWYNLLQESLQKKVAKSDGNLIPNVVAQHIVRDGRYAKMSLFLQEVEREARTFKESAAFKDGGIGSALSESTLETRQAFIPLIGKYIHNRLVDTKDQLAEITTRASIVSLETKTAETQWLEQGKDIELQKYRKRQPRPFVPDDTYQFWWFRNEYWVDEIGYYEFTIKTECFE